jgi:hypothetical protein
MEAKMETTKIVMEGFESFKAWAEAHGAFSESEMKDKFQAAYERSYFENGRSAEISPFELTGGRSKGMGDVYIVRADAPDTIDEGAYEFVFEE